MMAQAHKSRMVSGTTRLSKIKVNELENSYNEEVRLRKEAEKSIARLQLQAQALEQKHENKMRLLRNKEDHLLAKEREKVEKVKLQLKTLEVEHEKMCSKAKEFERKYNRELRSNRALTREIQKLERFKGQIESHNREPSLEKALTREKKKHESCKRERDAMREERDNALKSVEEIRTKQKRETDAMRKERDNALKLVEEIITKQREERKPLESFACPISHEVMDDPQITADGQTYEAEAIRAWFARGNHTSPATNNRLSHRRLVPNYALRSAIQEFMLANQEFK